MTSLEPKRPRSSIGFAAPQSEPAMSKNFGSKGDTGQMNITTVEFKLKTTGSLAHSIFAFAWREIELSLAIVGRSMFPETSSRGIPCSSGLSNVSNPLNPARCVHTDTLDTPQAQSNVLKSDAGLGRPRRSTSGLDVCDSANTGNLYPFARDWHSLAI